VHSEKLALSPKVYESRVLADPISDCKTEFHETAFSASLTFYSCRFSLLSWYYKTFRPSEVDSFLLQFYQGQYFSTWSLPEVTSVHIFCSESMLYTYDAKVHLCTRSFTCNWTPDSRCDKFPLDVKLIRYQFWCTRCAFRLLKSLQWCSGWKQLEIRNKMWKLKEPSDENQTECHEIEPNLSKDRAMHEGDNPSFSDEFTKFTYFFDSSIHIRILKQVPKYRDSKIARVCIFCLLNEYQPLLFPHDINVVQLKTRRLCTKPGAWVFWIGDRLRHLI
jgi:hypothetical protein